MSSAQAGKPFTVKHRRVDGQVVRDEPVYALCRCCGRVLEQKGDYCSPEHAALHQRLAR